MTPDSAPAPVLISVVAPVFNEEGVIEAVLAHWEKVLDDFGLPAEIVLTDDGCTDATPTLLAAWARSHPRLRVITHTRNGGYGKALQTAIFHSRGEYVITLDSDGQFDLAHAQALLDRMRTDHLDLVTGYRRAKQDSFLRVAADRALNLIVRVMFGVGYRDTNCALKVFRGELVRGVTIESRGFPAPTELLVKLHFLGARTGEEGIDHLPRTGGSSKLRIFRVGFWMLMFLFYLRFKLFLWRRRVLNTL